jgi:hypothetical protein
MIDTVTVLPAYKPAGDPVTLITTGNELVPDEDDATIPIELTSPNTGVLEPVVVIVAWSPLAMFARSLAPTDASTT